MLIRILILLITILSTNGFPSTNSTTKYNMGFQTPKHQEAYQKLTKQGSLNLDGLTSTILVEQTTDLTTSCIGADKICISRNHCPNGYIHITKSVIHSLSSKEQQCKIHNEVCCMIVEMVQVTSTKSGISEQNLEVIRNILDTEVKRPSATKNQAAEEIVVKSVNLRAAKEVVDQVLPDGSITNVSVLTVENSSNMMCDNTIFNSTPISDLFPSATHVQVGCAAALLCVEEKFCSIDGTIGSQPVSLSRKQLLQRVPLSTCKNPENGIIGKCCRDPNYVDPWPTRNLPANYSGGFDEQGFPTFLNIAKIKAPTTSPPSIKKTARPDSHSYNSMPTEEKLDPEYEPENSIVSSNVLIPPREIIPPNDNRGNSRNMEGLKLRCGVRNKASDKEEPETAFAEIPWQAMVLHSKQRTILCSGALVSNRHVITSASCVDSFTSNDISIKLGEWKLGYELKHEEPLPYKILNVSSITMHPGYTKGLGHHDIAILQLDSPATFDLHINPLCVPKTKDSEKGETCITTGWGKSILQAHYAGGIMHAVRLNILSRDRCDERLIKADMGLNAADEIICGIPKDEVNNVCEADVGGPLACQNENGLYELVGIYSQDMGCLSTNQVAIFAPLDEIWLKQTMFSSPSDENILTSSAQNTQDSILHTNNEYLPSY